MINCNHEYGGSMHKKDQCFKPGDLFCLSQVIANDLKRRDQVESAVLKIRKFKWMVNYF